MSETRVLITGANGFIGKNAREYFAGKGYSVYCLDNQFASTRIARREFAIDILDAQAFLDVVRHTRPEIVLHFAARTDLNATSLNDYETNYVGVRNVLSACRNAGTVRRVLLLSSMLVRKRNSAYDSAFGPFDASTAYGLSKAAGECVAWGYRGAQMGVVIARPTSIWGPYQGAPYDAFFRRVMRGAYFHVGRRSATKAFGYVGNLCAQAEALVASEERLDADEVYYLTDYEPYNVEAWANLIARKTGVRVRRAPYPALRAAAVIGDTLRAAGYEFPLTSFRLRNMTTDNVVPTTSMQRVLPDLPYDIETAVERTLQWYGGRRSTSW